MATATDAGRKLSDDKILWQGYCQFQPGESANVEWEKLNADRGALLRATIEAAADACADRLRTQLLDGSRETVAR